MKRWATKHRQAGVSVNYTTREERAGTHNRKARRASKATQQQLFTPPPFDAEAFAKKREARRRAELVPIEQIRAETEAGYQQSAIWLNAVEWPSDERREKAR